MPYGQPKWPVMNPEPSFGEATSNFTFSEYLFMPIAGLIVGGPAAICACYALRSLSARRRFAHLFPPSPTPDGNKAIRGPTFKFGFAMGLLGGYFASVNSSTRRLLGMDSNGLPQVRFQPGERPEYPYGHPPIFVPEPRS